MIAALILLALSRSGECLEPWSTVWYVRAHYEYAPGQWTSQAIAAKDFEWWSRAAAVARRDDILAHGWAWPHLIPGPQDPNLRGETRVAPGALRYVSVKRMCCRMDLPPQERPPCEYPDGDPPPEP